MTEDTLAEFAKESARGGGNFLRASDLSNGLNGSILRAPSVERRDFKDGKGEKLIANCFMEVSGRDGECTWSPGKNAVRYLFEVLGPDEKKWKYPIPGHFEARNVQTSQGTKLAWLFIPDLESGKKPTVSRTTTGTMSEFTCGVPDCGAKFDSVARLQKHITVTHA